MRQIFLAITIFIYFFNIFSYGMLNVKEKEISEKNIQSYEKSKIENETTKLNENGETVKAIEDIDAIKVTTTTEKVIAVKEIDDLIFKLRETRDEYTKRIAELEKVKKDAGY